MPKKVVKKQIDFPESAETALQKTDDIIQVTGNVSLNGRKNKITRKLLLSAVQVSPRVIKVGAASCSHRDKFDPNRGTMISTHRAFGSPVAILDKTKYQDNDAIKIALNGILDFIRVNPNKFYR